MTFSGTPDERVLDVHFSEDALSVSLRDGRIITVPLVWYPRLFNGTASQRRNWKIAGGGYGVHWPDLDEDLSTQGLLRGAPAPNTSPPGTPQAVNRVLSAEEQELISMIAAGLKNREISASLGISEPAVRTRLQEVFRKLRVGSRKSLLLPLLEARPPRRRVG